MAIKVDHHWPLTVVRPVRENALQKEPVSNFPSQSTRKPMTLERLPDRKVGTSWEKGTFVDIYI